ncbi:hypothetical protein HN258_19135, partial [Acinetobacter baumannii]|nr:hypothetical protein [Acinetobacter baumannii]
NAPVLDPINATDPVSGTAEAGSTVTVTYPDGTTATVVAGTDGVWTVCQHWKCIVCKRPGAVAIVHCRIVSAIYIHHYSGCRIV